MSLVDPRAMPAITTEDGTEMYFKDRSTGAPHGLPITLKDERSCDLLTFLTW